MRYHWLAQYLVKARFPQLNQKTRNEIVSEAICRAWCSFLVLDYRLMESCIQAAALRKGVVPAEPPEALAVLPVSCQPAPTPRRAHVIRLSDYR